MTCGLNAHSALFPLSQWFGFASFVVNWAEILETFCHVLFGVSADKSWGLFSEEVSSNCILTCEMAVADSRALKGSGCLCVHLPKIHLDVLSLVAATSWWKVSVALGVSWSKVFLFVLLCLIFLGFYIFNHLFQVAFELLVNTCLTTLPHLKFLCERPWPYYLHAPDWRDV